jgi:hypothetical protein
MISEMTTSNTGAAILAGPEPVTARTEIAPNSHSLARIVPYSMDGHSLLLRVQLKRSESLSLSFDTAATYDHAAATNE